MIPLDNYDLKTLKKELIQRIIPHALVLIILSTFCLTIYILILTSTNNLFHHIANYTFFTLLFFGSLWARIKGPYFDIISKVKYIEEGFIEDKILTKNDGWHSNPFQNSKAHAVLIEHAIIVNNKKYFIEENLFNSLNKGDEIELHFASNSSKLIKITSR